MSYVTSGSVKKFRIEGDRGRVRVLPSHLNIFYSPSLTVCFLFMGADERMSKVEMIRAMKRNKAELEGKFE